MVLFFTFLLFFFLEKPISLTKVLKIKSIFILDFTVCEKERGLSRQVPMEKSNDAKKFE